MTIKEWQRLVHDNSVQHGFWPDRTTSVVPEKLCLIHSEVSEALEAYRDPGHDPLDYWLDGAKPEGLGAELADVVIRVMDLCGGFGIDLEKCIAEKHEYNRSRPIKHGGKRI